MLPPLVGVAVKITGNPAQISIADAAIETAGVTGGLTVTAGAVDIAERGEAQSALDVIVTRTTSPFTKELVVYELEFVPTFTPPFFH